MRLYSLFLLFSVLSLSQQFSFCQSLSTKPTTLNPKPLSIGDTLPNFALSSIRHTENVGDRLIILDFWATWCASCIHNFPKLNALRQQFADSLQIVLVNAASTGDTEAKIKKLFSSLEKKWNQPISFPLINNDTILSKLFPHDIFPHYVWIHKGIVKAITGAEEVNATHIRDMLSGKELNLEEKKILVYDPSKPLLFNNNGGSPTSLYINATFTNYLQGFGSGMRKWKDSNIIKLTFTNQSILTLYQYAYGFEPNKLLVKTKDSSRFFRTVEEQPMPQDNLYCLELLLPANKSNDWKKRMASQLDAFFDLQSGMQKVSIPVWVITGKGKNIDTKGGKRHWKSYTAEDPCTIMINHPLSSLAAAMNFTSVTWKHKPIILDETSINGNVDMVLNADPKDISAMKKELQQYGLKLKKARRNLEVFVVNDNNN